MLVAHGEVHPVVAQIDVCIFAVCQIKRFSLGQHWRDTLLYPRVRYCAEIPAEFIELISEI